MSSLRKHAHSLISHLKVFGLLRGLPYWLIALRNQKHPYTIAQVESPAGQIDLRLGTTDIEVYQKVFIDEEYKLPHSHIPHTILDLGANTGIASRYFLNLYPSAYLVAVEPDPSNFDLLCRNLSGLPNVKPIRAAVWTHDGEIQLFDPGIGAWGLQVSENTTSSAPSLSVPAISLPSLLREFPSGQIDLLKIDIEGAEKELLENADSWMPAVNAIVIELHDRYKPGCGRAFYRATDHLPNEKLIGENVWAWRLP